MSNEQLENLEELGRRAVACKHWQWMPGMRYRVGSVVGRLTDNQCKGKLPLVPDAFPDLSDPATRGCILALVRRALGRIVWVQWNPYIGFQVMDWNGPNDILVITTADSEVAALVAALEGAR